MALEKSVELEKIKKKKRFYLLTKNQGSPKGKKR